MTGAILDPLIFHLQGKFTLQLQQHHARFCIFEAHTVNGSQACQ